jgi:hypothetical protein
VVTDAASALVAQAEAAWAGGDGETAMALFGRAVDAAEAAGDLEARVAAVLGLARGQRYNVTPGLLPVRLHAVYDDTGMPRERARLAAALSRCWAYANKPQRAKPFAVEALELADQLDDPVLIADALDSALTAHWGPDDLVRRCKWAVRLDDVCAYLPDADARLQAHIWGLTVAWEVLDLPRMHRCMREIEQVAEESARARFFAASRRLALELLRKHTAVAPMLISAAEAAAAAAVIPDGEGVLHGMRGYTALVSGDVAGCAAAARAYEEYAVENGVPTVRAEAAVIWLGAGRPDKVAEMIGVFTPDVLDALPRDSDWLLTLQCVLEGAVAVQDREVATAAVALLAPYEGRSVVNAGAVMWHGVTDDTLARGFGMLGDAAAAARHRAAALATYERIGATWWRDRLRSQLPPGPTHPSDTVVVHLHRQPGGLWLVGRESATFMLPRMRGLEHVHALLLRPDTAIPASVLIGGEVVVQDGMEVIDHQGRRMLHARLAEIDAQSGDRPDLRRERDAITRYLGGATGLAGRDRTTGSHSERARVAVRKAIIAALARIAEADPWLGRHLRNHIRTGVECRYESEPDQPIHWVLRPSGQGDDPGQPRGEDRRW